MGDIIFARTRWEYDSYKDYRELVRLSGFKEIFVDEIDLDSDNVYVFTPANGETINGWRTPHRCRIVHHQLEWAVDSENNVPPGVDEVWASDPEYAKQIGARYVMLGSHPGLNLHPERTFATIHDVILLQYLTPRRQRIRHELQLAALSIAPDGWGAARDEALASSALCIHIHQHDGIATVAPLRFALAAAYHLPILTEQTTAQEGIPPCMQAEYGALVDSARVLRRNMQARIHFGAALYQALCIDNQFKTCVERAV